MRRHAALVAGAMLTVAVVYAQDYGHFIGDVVAKWSPDGRNMVLTQPFVYVDPEGVRWEAPLDSVIDGASIPQFAWSIIGGPFEGKYRAASVIHDVACVNRSRPWATVHRAFYTAMLASGAARAQAKVMYAAVYHFGPRWATLECPGRMACAQPTIVFPPPRTLTEDQFPRLAEDIARRERPGGAQHQGCSR